MGAILEPSAATVVLVFDYVAARIDGLGLVEWHNEALPLLHLQRSCRPGGFCKESPPILGDAKREGIVAWWQVFEIADFGPAHVFPSGYSTADQHRVVEEQVPSEAEKSKSQQHPQDSYPKKPAIQIQIINKQVQAHVVDGLSEQKVVKLAMVVPANAIANPKAMMIVSFYANSAFPAVPSPVFTCELAYVTVKLIRLGFAQQAI